MPQLVGASSSSSSSSYSRSASQPRDSHSASRPAVRAPCQQPRRPESAHRTPVGESYPQQQQQQQRATTAATARPSDGSGASTAGWTDSLDSGCRRQSANCAAYDSCIAAITRQQMDSFTTRCPRPQRPHAVAAPARHIRQNPTVV